MILEWPYGVMALELIIMVFKLEEMLTWLSSIWLETASTMYLEMNIQTSYFIQFLHSLRLSFS